MVGPEQDVPEYREGEVRVAPGIELSFDPQRKLFILGKGEQATTLPLSDLDNPLDVFYINSDLQSEPTEEDLLLINWGGLAVLPRMRQRLSELASDSSTAERMAQITNSSMIQVLKKIRPDIKLPPMRKSTSAFYFRTAISPNEGRFFINTFGNCACLGPYPESHAVYVPDELQSDTTKQLDLPAGYSVHNIDFPGQMASLLAGAGTLAWIAKNGLES